MNTAYHPFQASGDFSTNQHLLVRSIRLYYNISYFERSPPRLQ